MTLNYRTLDDWYALTRSTFSKYDGMGLIAKYGYSPSDVVMSIFQHHKWQPWRFVSVRNSYWGKKSNQREYLEWLGETLGFKAREDWYNIFFSLVLLFSFLFLYLFLSCFFSFLSFFFVFSLFPLHFFLSFFILFYILCLYFHSFIESFPLFVVCSLCAANSNFREKSTFEFFGNFFFFFPIIVATMQK